MSPNGASYRAAGVDYDALDAGKRQAMARALATSGLLAARGGKAIDASRGEPAFVFELGSQTFAFVVEGLGTKSVIARQVLESEGINRFAEIAYDTVAAILNDLICVGALPLVANAYFATGSSDWYADEQRSLALLEGWQAACRDAGCVWGGGESPSLAGLVGSEDIELAGAAVGALPEGQAPLLGEALAVGDEIVLVCSSGLHANGASLARLIAGRLPEGWATKLPDGQSFGEAVLAPSLLYVPLLAALFERRVPVHYLSHITGHGLLKLMRPSRELGYVIERLPAVPAVLDFLAEQAELDPAAAYSTFNMGAGFAVYCAPGAGETVVRAAKELQFEALVAGVVSDGPRRVVLDPVGVSFDSSQLDLSGNAP